MGMTSISVAGRKTVAFAPAGKCLAPRQLAIAKLGPLGCSQLHHFEFHLSISPWPIGAGFCKQEAEGKAGSSGVGSISNHCREEV